MKEKMITYMLRGAILMMSLVLANSSWAYHSFDAKDTDEKNRAILAAGCAAATSQTQMELNNIRAVIETGGKYWFDRARNRAGYEVPKNSGIFAIFSGGLWMGGQDVNGQLKLAANAFGAGNDFYTGPLNQITAEVDAETCAKWDKFYKISKAEVATFIAYSKGEDVGEGYVVPNAIKSWPAHGNTDLDQDYYLAPFFDVSEGLSGDSSNGTYNYNEGDYPYYDFTGEIDCRRVRDVRLYGDETYWWIYNDKGNTHTEGRGPSIGMEVRAQAFAFATADEINNMTFFNYELINRSSFTLKNTYFAQFADSDLGCPENDFVGCDVSRGLGYTYNGSDVDGPCSGFQLGYEDRPAALGFDFFEGPYQDADQKDNPLTDDIAEALANDGITYEGIGIGYGDTIVDNERFGMRRFIYYSACVTTSVRCDPRSTQHYYNYMRGIWDDGSTMLHGGNGHKDGGGDISTAAAYMFPDDSDPLNFGTLGIVKTDSWSEVSAGNTPADRRMLQSAGPFTLKPGAVNDITIGVVWARATSGGAWASVEKLREADDKAQTLFDNCFKILDGPDAPVLEIVELENELVINITNPSVSNNYGETYAETDDNIITPDSLVDLGITYDAEFKFQGYKIYQVKRADVSVSDLDDIELARLVYQADIKDGVAELINYTFNEDTESEIPATKVNGDSMDIGISHSISITKDAFATGTDLSLANHKTYYFIGIAYANNNYLEYDPATGKGQKKPFLVGRKAPLGSGIKAVSAIPHNVVPENTGTKLNAAYGSGPEVTIVDGMGNGGNGLVITASSESEILSKTSVTSVSYEKKSAPINVKVIDPLSVQAGKYVLQVLDSTDSDNSSLSHRDLFDAYWRIYREGDTDTIYSESTLEAKYEQLIPEWGISITMEQVKLPAEDSLIRYEGNGAMYNESSISFGGDGIHWLTGVSDQDVCSAPSWIRSGASFGNNCPEKFYGDRSISITFPTFESFAYDPTSGFENYIQGTWAPYALAGYAFHSLPDENDPLNQFSGWGQPGFMKGVTYNTDLGFVNSVDIVFTNDKSKWTRCPVLEAQEDKSKALNDARRGSVRLSPSVDKYGNPTTETDASDNPEDANYISAIGMGWFPGYAIDVERGIRLNMAFSEDSWLKAHNGTDMLWNPTSTQYSKTDIYGLIPHPDVYVYGGKHYIYIFGAGGLPDESVSNTYSAYDAGKTLIDKLNSSKSSYSQRTSDWRDVWGACIWTGMPLLVEGTTLLQNDARIALRIQRPYDKRNMGNPNYDNGGLPMFTFSLDDLVPELNLQTYQDSILKLINVAPNPYYAYSEYEASKLDNIVKITNLPNECSIKIYNVNGTLVRSFNKSGSLTSLNWDLKNENGVSIGGGVYYIHVDVPDVGERVIKWFGSLRTIELDTY